MDGQHVAHNCILVAPPKLDKALIESVKQEAAKAFANVLMLQTTTFDERPWPIAPNAMFRCFLVWFKKNRKDSYFWWNEPDCIPIKPKFLELLEEEYKKCGKPFMGSVVTKPNRHLTGCAIYPWNAANYNPALEIGPAGIAWDCIEPEKTLKHTHHTELFHHQWFNFDGKGVPTFATAEDVARISKKAVVFHRNKDHTLIYWLRKDRTLVEDGLELGKRHRLAVRRAQNDDSVYTYYENIGRPDEAKIIEHWINSWSKHGWNPIVMSEKDIVHCPGWKSYVRAFAALPTINTPEYELACYKRWIAMVSRGGGLMVDYDVINYGFTPEKADELRDEDALVFMDGHVPCAVLGNKRLFKLACDYFKNYQVIASDNQNGKAHISDMYICAGLKGAPWIKSVPVAVEFGKEGWEKAPLVHYSNGRAPNGKLAAIASHA